MKLSREENWINYPRALKNPVLPWKEYILSYFLNKYFTSKSFIAEDFEANKWLVSNKMFNAINKD